AERTVESILEMLLSNEVRTMSIPKYVRHTQSIILEYNSRYLLLSARKSSLVTSPSEWT
ncbi:hypothetical protein K0M31_002673, partial [Melipona bicolor]